MTIKQHGGVFGRNPKFNNVSAESLTIAGNAVPDASTILVDGDIGSTVQAYDADTAKLDVAQTFTAAQTFDENIVMASGKGIDFSATGQAAGMTSELFDDYEEGSYTVSLFDASGGGNASPTTTTGYYTKVGNKVTACFNALENIDTTGMTSSNNLYMSLPFAASSTGASSGSFAPQSITFRAGAGMLVPVVENSASRVRFFSCAGAGIANNRVAELSSGVSDMYNFSITYFTS